MRWTYILQLLGPIARETLPQGFFVLVTVFEEFILESFRALGRNDMQFQAMLSDRFGNDRINMEIPKAVTNYQQAPVWTREYLLKEVKIPLQEFLTV